MGCMPQKAATQVDKSRKRRWRAALCASSALQAAALVLPTQPALAHPAPYAARRASAMALDRAVPAGAASRGAFLAGHVTIGTPPALALGRMRQITLRQAGLAGLAPPQSANAGMLTARLSRVVLGGAPVDVLDTYGDGLVGLNVTREVKQIRIGQRQVPGLITNAGTVLAPSGTVALSTGQADGLVKTLVAAGQRSLAGKTASRIVASGIGGDIEVDGPPIVPLRSVFQPPTPRRSVSFVAPTAIATPAPARAQPARHATASSRATYTASGTLTVAQTCAANTNCLTFAAFQRYNDTIVDYDGAIIFQPGSTPASQTLTAAHPVSLTTTAGVSDQAASGLIQFDTGLSVFAPSFTINSAGNVVIAGVLGGINGTASAMLVTASGGITEHQAANLGRIDAQSLNLTSQGGIVLDNPANAAGTLTNATATAGVQISDGQSLIVSGPVDPGPGQQTAILVTGQRNSLTGSGAISGASVSLGAAQGEIDLTGAITAGTLGALASGAVRLDNAENSITTVGSTGVFTGLSGQSVTLATTGSLTIAAGATVTSTGGDVSIAVQDGDLTLLGTIQAQNLAALSVTAGNIAGNAGVIDAATLTALASSELGGDVALGGGNSITALGASSATGSFSLADHSLTVLGNAVVSGVSGLTLTLGGAALTQNTGSQLVSSAGAVTIDGALTQLAGTLTAFGTASITGGVVQSGSASILGTAVSISGGTLSQTGGTIAGTGTVLIELSGGLSQTGGTISGGAGGVTIGIAGNLAQTAGVISSAGNLDIGSSGGALTFGGTLQAASGTITLTAPHGAITEGGSGAALIASSLTGSASGQVALDAASGAASGNQIGTITGFTSSASFSLVDGMSLTLAGGLVAPSVSLRTPALDILPAASIAAGPGGTVSLAADAYIISGAVSDPAGLVALGLLHRGVFSVAPNGTIDSTSIALIYTGTGTLALGSTDGATANGFNTLPAGGTWTLATAGSVTTLDLGAGLTVTGRDATLGLFSNGAVNAGGGLAAGTLYGASATDFLAPAGNAITDIGTLGLSAGGSLVLSDTGPLSLDAGSAASPTTVAGLHGVTLAATGQTITQASQSRIESNLGEIVISAAALRQSGGAAITANGLLSIALTGDLTQDAGGTLASTAGNLSLSSGLGNLVLAGSVSAPSGQVDLSTGAGTITQSAGGAPTGTLVAGSVLAKAGTLGTPGADLWLGQASANRFTVIDDATATGTLNLGDSIGATLAAGASIAGTAAVTLTLGGLGLTQDSLSAISSADGPVTINAATLSQATGATVSAPNDAVSLSGNLAQAGGSVTALRDISLGGAATQTGGTIAASQDVLIGTLSGPGGTTATLLMQSAGATLSAGGSVTVFGAATQDGSSLTGSAGIDILSGLTQSDNATLSGGTIAIGNGTLAAALTQDASSITATSGNVTVLLTGDLAQGTAGGIVSQSGAITLQSSAGTLFLGGQIDASHGLAELLARNGDITETARDGTAATGRIDALTLAAQAGMPGGAARDVKLTAGGGNNIGTLAGIGTSSESAATFLFALTDQTALTLAGGVTLSGGGGVTLTLAPGLALTQAPGSAIVSAGAVDIAADSTVMQSGAALTASAGVSVSGNLTQQGANRLIASGGDILIGGSAAQTASTIDAQAGAVSIGGILLQSAGTLLAAHGVSIGAALFPSGTTATVVTQSLSSLMSAGETAQILGGVAQDASRVDAAGALTIDASVAQADHAALTGSSVTIGPSGLAATLSQSASGITATAGSLAISLTGALTQDAASTLTSPAGNISLASRAGGLYLAGLTAAPAGFVHLAAPAGAITETAPDSGSATGSLIAATLSAQAGGTTPFGLILDHAGANRIGTITTASATGTLILADAVNLTLAAGGTIAGDQGVSLSLPGQSFTQAAGSVVTAGGVVTQQGGALLQSAGAVLSGADGVTLTLTGGLSQGSTSRIDSLFGNLIVTATGGDIAFAGLLETGAGTGSLVGTVALRALAGGIAAAHGTLQTGVLTAAAAGNIVLTGASNRIGAIAASPSTPGLLAGGTLDLADSVALSVPGLIEAQDGVTLSATGGLTETAGATIRSEAGPLSIESPGTLSVAGTLAAPQILLGDLQAPRQIAWTGGTILTGSSIPAKAGGGSPSIADPIGPASRLYAQGLFATAGQFIQTGTTSVAGLNGARRQTVELRLKGPGGLIAFDPRAGLAAPSAQLLLDLQKSGRATGAIDVAGLNLYYYGLQPGRSGGSTLTGLVDGRGGAAAAASGFVHSLPGVNYALNDCPIESVSCVLLSPVVVPLGNPVRDIVVSVHRRRQDEDDLILPNVGELDY